MASGSQRGAGSRTPELGSDGGLAEPSGSVPARISALGVLWETDARLAWDHGRPGSSLPSPTGQPSPRPHPALTLRRSCGRNHPAPLQTRQRLPDLPPVSLLRLPGGHEPAGEPAVSGSPARPWPPCGPHAPHRPLFQVHLLLQQSLDLPVGTARARVSAGLSRPRGRRRWRPHGEGPGPPGAQLFGLGRADPDCSPSPGGRLPPVPEPQPAGHPHEPRDGCDLPGQEPGHSAGEGAAGPRPGGGAYSGPGPCRPETIPAWRSRPSVGGRQRCLGGWAAFGRALRVQNPGSKCWSEGSSPWAQAGTALWQSFPWVGTPPWPGSCVVQRALAPRAGWDGVARPGCPDWPVWQGSPLLVGSDLLKFEASVSTQEPGTFSFRTPKVCLPGWVGRVGGPHGGGQFPPRLDGITD